MCVIQDWCSLSLKSAQASLYIIRDGHKSWDLLGESFQLPVWLIFPAGSLCHTEKVNAWEKTYKELLKKNTWLRVFTGLFQFPLSQLMTLDDKCIFNRYPMEYLEFLCVYMCLVMYMCGYVCICIHVLVCICAFVHTGVSTCMWAYINNIIKAFSSLFFTVYNKTFLHMLIDFGKKKQLPSSEPKLYKKLLQQIYLNFHFKQKENPKRI